jgi:FkbM family methyltransferase
MTTSVVRHPAKGIAAYMAKRLRLRLSRGKPDVPVTVRNKLVTLDGRDNEQKYFVADCIKEPENLIVYRALAKAGLARTFVDIGANCGHVANSILDHYDKLILIEPNPKLMRILRTLYADESKVTLIESAIVDEASPRELTLRVPHRISGLATLGSTDFLKDVSGFDDYKVKAATLAEVTKGEELSAAYVKIDIEGFEEKVIASAHGLFNASRPIVGFEALSRDAAAACARLFSDCVFYHARFDFMDESGSLRKSTGRLLGGALKGSDFCVWKEPDMAKASAQNFSQVFAVPVEKSAAFEQALTAWSRNSPAIDLAQLSSR